MDNVWRINNGYISNRNLERNKKIVIVINVVEDEVRSYEEN
ncbi:hypothetical protein [uncultured Clostridium sp.]|nr:hypothetical protein [uncultured Clostridium sp.]